MPGGWTIISGQGTDTLEVIPDTTDGMVGVTSCNQCGCGQGITITVTADSCNTFCLAMGGIHDDHGYSIIQSTDGGYVIVGATKSFCNSGWPVYYDAYVVKLDNLGNLQWTKTIGGASYEGVRHLVPTAGGGYVLVGGTSSFGQGSADVYVLKLDDTGNIQWTRTVGGPVNDYGHSIIHTADGGYVLAGYTFSFGQGLSDVYVVKLDSIGSVQWTVTIGGANSDWGSSVIQTVDGGYAVAGFTNSFGQGGYDVYIMKLDSSGNLQWARTVGGAQDDAGHTIIQTADKGYVVVGRTQSFCATGCPAYNDVYVVKLDSAGNLQWTRTIGGANDDYGRALVQSDDGGYVIVGFTNSFGQGGFDVYVIKLDSAGNLQWTRTIGGTNDDYGLSIIQTTDGGFAIAGYTNSFGQGGWDVYVVKLDGTGNLQSCPGGCIVSTGGMTGTGGNVGSGGIVSSGGLSASGGFISSGGVVTSLFAHKEVCDSVCL